MRIKSLLLNLSLLLGLLSAPLLAAPAVAYADVDASRDAACVGVGISGGSCSTASAGRLTKVVETVVNLLSVIVGIVAVIMVIVAGFKYVTSGGESSNVSSAKNTLIYAIIGLIIVALAQFIVTFVLDNV